MSRTSCYTVGTYQHFQLHSFGVSYNCTNPFRTVQFVLHCTLKSPASLTFFLLVNGSLHCRLEPCTTDRRLVVMGRFAHLRPSAVSSTSISAIVFLRPASCFCRFVGTKEQPSKPGKLRPRQPGPDDGGPTAAGRGHWPEHLDLAWPPPGGDCAINGACCWSVWSVEVDRVTGARTHTAQTDPVPSQIQRVDKFILRK